MKVLIINQHPIDTLGGSEIQCDLIATWLSRFGHQVMFFAIKAQASHYQREYDIFQQKGNFFIDLIKVLKKVSPDIVYWRYNKKNLFLSVIICKLLRAKLVFSISTYSDIKPFIWTGIHPFEGISNNWKQYKSLKAKIRAIKRLFDPLNSFLNYTGFYFIDGVVGIQKKLTNKLPVKKQITIYNSMNNETEKNIFNWKKPYIVWVANIKSKKNPELFIELASRLTNEDVDFIMIGKIQQKGYQKILSGEHLPPNFFYLGFKTPTEVNSILSQSLFLVHTCNPEGFGNNFIQSWLQKKPTITLFFDPDDLIKSNGLGFHSMNFEQLILDTQTLIRKDNLRNKLGENAKKFAVKQFDPENNARKFEKFFIDIINH